MKIVSRGVLISKEKMVFRKKTLSFREKLKAFGKSSRFKAIWGKKTYLFVEHAYFNGAREKLKSFGKSSVKAIW